MTFVVFFKLSQTSSQPNHNQETMIPTTVKQHLANFTHPTPNSCAQLTIRSSFVSIIASYLAYLVVPIKSILFVLIRMIVYVFILLAMLFEYVIDGTSRKNIKLGINFLNNFCNCKFGGLLLTSTKTFERSLLLYAIFLNTNYESVTEILFPSSNIDMRFVTFDILYQTPRAPIILRFLFVYLLSVHFLIWHLIMSVLSKRSGAAYSTISQLKRVNCETKQILFDNLNQYHLDCNKEWNKNSIMVNQRCIQLYVLYCSTCLWFVMELQIVLNYCQFRVLFTLLSQFMLTAIMLHQVNYNVSREIISIVLLLFKILPFTPSLVQNRA